MQKKILVITKDVGGGFNLLYPVVKKLRDGGYKIVVLAEGCSLQRWLDVKEEVCQRNDFRKVFEEVLPEAVITELADPINLAEVFGLEANRRNIPLIFIEDLWGVCSRSKAIPQLICAFDEFSADMANRLYTNRHAIRIVITGNPAMDRLVNMRGNNSSQGIRGGNHCFHGQRIVVALGQNKSTTPMLEGIVDVLEKVGNYILIPRFSPKWLSNPNNTIYRQHWDTILKKVRNGEIMRFEEESTHDLMMIAHEVVSIYSTGLIEAAILGAIPVSWISEVGREEMAVSLSGLRQFPLVSIGAAIEVSSSEEYLRRVPSFASNSYLQQIELSRSRVLSDGKSTDRVVRAISDLLSS